MQDEFEYLKPSFRSWLQQQSNHDVEPTMGLVSFVLTNCAMWEQETEITALSVETFRSVLELLEEQFPETLESAKIEMLGFLEFLDESDEFTGSNELFEQLCILVDEQNGPAVGDLVPATGSPGTQAPSVLGNHLTAAAAAPQRSIFSSSLAVRETQAAIESLAMTRRTRAFLRWLGGGRVVTWGGLLRRSDIQEAAATLDEHALGVARISAAATRAPEPGRILEVRSMADAPRLALYWKMLLTSGLMYRLDNKMRITALGQSVLDQDGQDTTYAILEMAAAAYCVLAGVLPRCNGQTETFAERTAQVLVSGASANPMPTRYVGPREPGTDAKLEMLAEARYPRIGGRIHLWADDGLVDVAENLMIPEVLLPALAAALAEPYDLAISKRSPRLGQLSGGAGTHHVLRIDLEGSAPVVSRTLQVPSGITLGELCALVEVCFEWDGTRFHRFEAGVGETAAVPIHYVPFHDGQEDWLSAGERHDEDQAVLADVLEGPGRRITFIYDFGDRWEHTITVQGIVPATDSPRQALCLGGQSMAPVEDIGGITGWAQALEAVADPRHPHHQKYCFWLDAEPGRGPDPAAFTAMDLAQVQDRLDHVWLDLAMARSDW